MLLEKYVQPGITTLDVGCGSGILSIAALKLGADKAIGVDIDPLSVKASYENAALNLVTEAIRVYQGSVSELLDGIAGIKESPLVLANILAPVIIRLFDAGMGQLVSDGGTIILSGILDHQAADVIRSGEKHGLQLIDKAQINDWVALAMEKA
jgi:ribosomal protein L11 methyltransferase